MIKCLISLLLCFQISLPVSKSELVEFASSAILIDAYSTQVLYGKNEYERLHPASMTKMMGMLLMYEKINDGSIHWDDVIVVSAYAASMGGSQIYLEENEKMTLEDLFTAICVSSANDAMVAVSEYIAGSEALFVDKMNEKVVELGLQNTHFSNSTGLDITNHYSCAYDMAMIASEVLKISNETVTTYTSLYEAYLREDTSPFWLVNTNKLIRSYEGMDGLKTGFTQIAGYCLTATAKRDNMRLIAVVMKESTKENRNRDIKSLLDYGFSNYQQTTIYPKDTIFDTIIISNGKPNKVNMVSKENVDVVSNKTTIIETTSIIINPIVIQAPVSTNDPIAKIQIRFNTGYIYEGYLYPQEEILELEFLDIVCDFFIQFLLS